MNIDYTKQAKKSIERLDVPTKGRIRKGINGLPGGDVKKLKGYNNLYRLTIGGWRVLFTMIANDIMIEDILPRGDAYKGGL